MVVVVKCVIIPYIYGNYRNGVAANVGNEKLVYCGRWDAETTTTNWTALAAEVTITTDEAGVYLGAKGYKVTDRYVFTITSRC